MEDAIINVKTTLAPKNLSQLNWIKNSDVYYYINAAETPATLYAGNTSIKADEKIITLIDVNDKLHRLKQDTLTKFPVIEWKTDKRFVFTIDKNEFEYEALFNGIESVKQEYLDKTHSFYETYGPKTIIMARFVPIVRTFMPFVAGMGAMTYPKFLVYSVIGALAWVGICVTAGFFFGNIPFVKKNFELVLIGIIFVSVLPMFFEFLQHRKQADLAKAEERR